MYTQTGDTIVTNLMQQAGEGFPADPEAEDVPASGQSRDPVLRTLNERTEAMSGGHQPEPNRPGVKGQPCYCAECTRKFREEMAERMRERVPAPRGSGLFSCCGCARPLGPGEGGRLPSRERICRWCWITAGEDTGWLAGEG